MKRKLQTTAQLIVLFFFFLFFFYKSEHRIIVVSNLVLLVIIFMRSCTHSVAMRPFLMVVEKCLQVQIGNLFIMNMMNPICRTNSAFVLDCPWFVLFLPVSFSLTFWEKEDAAATRKTCSRFFSDHLFLIQPISIVYFSMVNSCLLFAFKHCVITKDVNQRHWGKQTNQWYILDAHCDLAPVN